MVHNKERFVKRRQRLIGARSCFCLFCQTLSVFSTITLCVYWVRSWRGRAHIVHVPSGGLPLSFPH
jgi:hypothetical protein